MKTKTRKIFIERTTMEIVDEKLTMVKRIYPCKVNAAVPFNHRMLR